MPQRIKDMRDSAIDAAGISLATKTTWSGAGTGILGFLASVNWIGLAGVLIALGGLCANLYFQARRDRRESAESAARIDALRERCEL